MDVTDITLFGSTNVISVLFPPLCIISLWVTKSAFKSKIVTHPLLSCHMTKKIALGVVSPRRMHVHIRDQSTRGVQLKYKSRGKR